MASRARSEVEREMLLNMATTWDSLAQSRLEGLQRKERLEALNPKPNAE